jgi:hypothetical protein
MLQTTPRSSTAHPAAQQQARCITHFERVLLARLGDADAATKAGQRLRGKV